MEYFVRRAGRVLRTRVRYAEEETVPVTTLKDCLQYQTQMDIGDRFVAPGILVAQKNGLVSGTRPSGATVFSFNTDTTLEKFIVDKNRLFALDRAGKAHIFHWNGTTPEVHDLHRHPVGWCVVPKTRMMVTWNVLALRVTDPDSNGDLFLKGHHARVTTVAAASAVVASGDASGYLCIWYVASWKRFHNIHTGTDAIEQVVLTDDHVAVRTRTYVYQYDVTTGKKVFDLEVAARAIEYTHRGLFVAHDGLLELFVKQESAVIFAHNVSQLVRSTYTRCWCVHDRHLAEVELNEALEQWPKACMRWIQQPTLPFAESIQSPRYMDVLALAAAEWLPRVDLWEPPRRWFRHAGLRQAIWKWAAKHNIGLAAQWLFLPATTLGPWFDLCRTELLLRTKSFEYAPHTVDILEHVYRRIRIKDASILKWCWFHHGKLRMRPVLLRLTETHDALLDIVASDTGSPTAILCFHPETVKAALESGHAPTFLRLLEAYHTRFAPSDNTRKIYQYLANVVFTTLDDDTCDVPMIDTGYWKPTQRFMPTDVGKYVKTKTGSGFVTQVVHRPDGQSVQWVTRGRTRALDTDSASLWTCYFDGAPHTMLECALTLLSADKWSCTDTSVPFRWFESQVGAFYSLGQRVRIFDNVMRITHALWDDTGASIETTTLMKVHESAQMPVMAVVAEWSYLADTTYDLTPLKLKVCTMIGKRRLQLAPSYARELFACCVAKSIVAEHQWDMRIPVTAATANLNTFIIGLKTGAIYEFDCVSSFNSPLRAFMHHETPILQLHTYGRRLLSVSDTTLCIWCLKHGVILFRSEAREQFMTAIPYVAMQYWVVERGEYLRATLWDIEDEIPLRQIRLPTLDALDAFHIDSLSVIVSSSRIVLWSEEGVEHEFALDVDGKVTCLCATPNGVAGATSAATLFMVVLETQKKTQWASLGGIVTTAMAPLDGTDCLLLGDATGHLTLWNLQTHTFQMTTAVSSSAIEQIFVDSLFAFVVHADHIKLVSVVQERGSLACHGLRNMLTWSPAWKQRIHSHVDTCVKPVVTECLRQHKVLAVALDIIEDCCEEYGARARWCDDDIVEMLLDMPLQSSKTILKRLISFKGPRIDCPICGDDEAKDTVSYLATCHHRFHTRCIHEHIRKTPEYHEQMQYEYALAVELKCPTCRAPFEPRHVKRDAILDCT